MRTITLLLGLVLVCLALAGGGDPRSGSGPSLGRGTEPVPVWSDLPAGLASVASARELPEASVPACSAGFERCVYYAGDEYEGSNLASAGLAFRRPALSEEECESPQGNYPFVSDVRREVHGGNSYLVFETGEAGMSKVARDTVHRAWLLDDCTEFVLRVATTNPAVYEPGAVEVFTAQQHDRLRTLLRGLIGSAELAP